MGNPQAVKTAIGQKVNALYGSPVTGRTAISGLLSPVASALSATAVGTAIKTAVEKIATPPAATVAAFANPAAMAAQQPLVPQQHDRGLPAAHAPSPAHPPAPAPAHHDPVGHVQPPDHGLYEWTARIECKKYELGCSYSICLFLGEVPEDPEQWLVSPNYVGGHHCFVNTALGHCANCRNKSDLLEEGFVNLNEGIVKHSGLHNLEPDAVKPYLTQNLHWRVQKV